jgi:hypothetical protein
MKMKTKKYKQNSKSALILLILAIALLYVPLANASTLSPKDNTLVFLTNVASIDISKYNVSLVSDKQPYNVINGASQEEVRYMLENKNGKLDVTALFKDSKLIWCTMYVLSGTPSFIQSPSANMLDQVRTILDRYQTFTGSSRYQSMKDILGSVNSTTDATISQGNTKLVIHSDGLAKGFEWTNTYNGVDGPGLQLEFYNGILETFNDQAALFTIGSTVKNIDEEDAINIALNQIKNFSWSINSNSTAMQVSKFTLLNNFTQATLTLQVREDSTLYPMWRVEIPVDQVYLSDGTLSNGVYSIAVGIWADTGAISYCQALSYGGAINGAPTTMQTSTKPQSKMAEWLNLGFAIGIVAITFAIAAVAIQKRRNK